MAVSITINVFLFIGIVLASIFTFVCAHIYMDEEERIHELEDTLEAYRMFVTSSTRDFNRGEQMCKMIEENIR